MDAFVLFIASRITGSLPDSGVGILHWQGIVFSAASGWLFTDAASQHRAFAELLYQCESMETFSVEHHEDGRLQHFVKIFTAACTVRSRSVHDLFSSVLPYDELKNVCEYFSSFHSGTLHSGHVFTAHLFLSHLAALQFLQAPLSILSPVLSSDILLPGVRTARSSDAGVFNGGCHEKTEYRRYPGNRSLSRHPPSAGSVQYTF